MEFRFYRNRTNNNYNLRLPSRLLLRACIDAWHRKLLALAALRCFQKMALHTKSCRLPTNYGEFGVRTYRRRVHFRVFLSDHWPPNHTKTGSTIYQEKHSLTPPLRLVAIIYVTFDWMTHYWARTVCLLSISPWKRPFIHSGHSFRSGHE